VSYVPIQAIGNGTSVRKRFETMDEIAYYRGQAERARRLGRSINHSEARVELERMGRDYDDIADDLESGAIEIRHPEMIPQRHRSRLGKHPLE
jgi:hypothetical protein